MPSKNIVKTYLPNTYYHVYNRGVAKQDIFLNKRDYLVFLSYLKDSLDEPAIYYKNFDLQGRTFKGVPRLPKNYKGKIDLICFCLMPNHFHLLLRQEGSKDMSHFMRSLMTRYSIYFNKAHDRVGPIFQGKYKAIIISTDTHLLHLSRYIHLNPVDLYLDLSQAYSSYADYLHIRKRAWIKPKVVLDYFEKITVSEIRKSSSYQNFVENHKKQSKDYLGELVLE